jgi:hypothetical protein
MPFGVLMGMLMFINASFNTHAGPVLFESLVTEVQFKLHYQGVQYSDLQPSVVDTSNISILNSHARRIEVLVAAS